MSEQESLLPEEPRKPSSEWDKQSYIEKAERVLNFLNKLTGKKYRGRNPSGTGQTANADVIISRIKDGYTKEDFERVIRTKCAEWSGSDTMRDKLRPSTLFRKSNFDQYVAATEQQAGTVPRETDIEPEPYDVIESFLSEFDARNGSWGYSMPPGASPAAAWWVNTMQEPCRPNEKSKLVEGRNGKFHWHTPYIDRLLSGLRKFLGMPRADQTFIVGAVEDGVPWRGDSMEMFARIYAEHMEMLEIGVDKYKETHAAQVARAIKDPTSLITHINEE